MPSPQISTTIIREHASSNDTQEGVTTPYHHDLHKDRKKPPITTTWEAE
jgi:hypothetical protein